MSQREFGHKIKLTESLGAPLRFAVSCSQTARSFENTRPRPCGRSDATCSESFERGEPASNAKPRRSSQSPRCTQGFRFRVNVKDSFGTMEGWRFYRSATGNIRASQINRPVVNIWEIGTFW